MLPTIEWQDGTVVMVDQRKLPTKEVYVRCKTANQVAKAIRQMVIRGAPAIGVAAAMGLALGVFHSRPRVRVSWPPSFTGYVNYWLGPDRQRLICFGQLNG